MVISVGGGGGEISAVLFRLLHSRLYLLSLKLYTDKTDQLGHGQKIGFTILIHKPPGAD